MQATLSLDRKKLHFVEAMRTRAQDMKDLLKSRGKEPVGAKSMLAQLVVAHLSEEDVEQFLITRSSKRLRIDAPSGHQSTLDVLFNAGTGRAA